MPQDPLTAPAAAGQINGARLRKASPMTKATTLKTPKAWNLLINHKQRAGERPQLTADLISLQHPTPTRSHHRELKHAATGATTSHLHSLSPADRAAGSPIGGAEAVEVGGRGPSGRVLQLTVVGTGGRWVLERDQIRRQLRALPSTLFVVDQEVPGLWRFEGGGFGHGAGLSQAGAIDLASRGWSSERILRHYFPGAELKPVKNLSSQGSP